MKIVVVDREEDLARVIEILQQAPGNEIQWARTGEEAVAMTQGRQVDLLITEVFIEPMNGFTLRNKMENRHGGIRTIFLSGYDLSPYAEHTAGYEVIPKPATPQKLFPAIARVMGGGSSAVAAAPVPVAVPKAASPAATPVAVPRAVAPSATPVAVPRVATPAATPVAVPRVATPAATPVAVPWVAATPAAIPTAIPQVAAVTAEAPVDEPVEALGVTSPAAPPAVVPQVTAVPIAAPVEEPVEALRVTAVPEVEPVKAPMGPADEPLEEPGVPVAEPVEAPRVPAAPAAMPVAIPRVISTPDVTVVPAPEPVAAPRVMAAPRPTALPAAEPAPAPRVLATPRPTAVPAAEPAPAPRVMATPRATVVPPAEPAPAPRVMATPRATALPPAEPAAAPRVMPTPRATPAAEPAAMPRVKAAPVAMPVPSAKVSTPQAAGQAPGTVRAVRAAVPVAADPLLGRTLGSYKVERRLGKGKWGPVYLAIQTSMNRPVAMEILAAEVAGDPAARENFVATARAKAAVQHPHILSVYEADQAEGHYFYTHEYVDGYTLAQLAARGEGLSEPMALQTIKYVAQGLSHLHNHKIAHSIPDATDIYIGSDGLPYLSNVALPTDDMPAMQEEICTLGQVISSALPGGQAQDRGLQAMLTRMGMTNQLGFQSWPPLFQAIQAIEPKVIPVDAFKLSAQDEAAIRAVEDARKRQKMVVIGSVAALVVFLFLLGGVIWWEFLRPETHDYSDEMVKIEAGTFIYQDGQKLTLPTFYIDKYEVTMAEYAKFLQYLKEHGNPTTFDSQLQPVGRSHVPRDWDIYYGRASSSLSGYRTVRGVPITLDCPVFNVDYFDAYAYAKWKGRRLPTEQEWEKAARGPAGNLYPWGNEWDPTKLNAGGDYQAAPGAGYKPIVDGYTWWAPVDAMQGDRSPYGVIGMAGNVSEWTDSWDASKTYVVIRGGNYKSTSEQALLTSSIKAFPQQVAETLGFRTAGDNAPGK